MASYVVECKNCGAENTCEEGQQVFVCTHCDSRNTVAKSANSLGGLFNRANYLRRSNEFDKALSAYEDILRQNDTDYEAHWGLVLCKYGIEYVEDPATDKRVPTCHRTQYESILNDPEYQAALESAPYEVRSLYEEEAAYIDKVQKEILALAQKQEKFDVFLCYKETDENGNRSEDSVLAQELEFELTKRRYRVFFARKTLEGKLGSAYEPLIFSALHSARVMVVLGTKAEHFGAPWVKNEWSRYRELIKKGEPKTIIPAYRGMSPYDLPQEFASLQALDMGKLGFVQDLCDGIDRITREGVNTTTPTPVPAAPGVESLLTRAHLFMEDGDWVNADVYIEKVLDIDPKYAPAYIAKLMVELKIKDEAELIMKEQPLTEFANFQKAMRFANAQQRQTYEGYISAFQERQENERLEDIYIQATTCMVNADHVDHGYGPIYDAAQAESQYREAQQIFESIPSYKDADEMAIECARLAKESALKAEAESAEKERQRVEREALEKRQNEKRTAVFNKVVYSTGILCVLAYIVYLLVNAVK